MVAVWQLLIGTTYQGKLLDFDKIKLDSIKQPLFWILWKLLLPFHLFYVSIESKINFVAQHNQLIILEQNFSLRSYGMLAPASTLYPALCPIALLDCFLSFAPTNS